MGSWPERNEFLTWHEFWDGLQMPRLTRWQRARRWLYRKLEWD